MAIIEFDKKNFSVLTSQRNADLRTAILIHFLPDESGLNRGQFLNDEDYIFALNKKYNKATIDIAPYHYFISIIGDEITVRENKNIKHRLNFVDHRKAYENDISIMICADKYSDLSTIAAEKIAFFMGEISVQNNVLLKEVITTNDLVNNILEIQEKAILFRNRIAPIFNVIEAALYKAERIVSFSYIGDSGDEYFPHKYASTSFNPYKSCYILNDSGQLLFPEIDYKISYAAEDGTCNVFLKSQTNSLSASIIKSPMIIVSNEDIRLISGVDSERYRKMIMDKYSIEETLFKKMNAHIYENHCDNYLNREYLVIPTAVCEVDYKAVNQLKKAETNVAFVSKFRT